MIERKKYLQLLDEFRNKQLIKVVTGIRRCGKSTLFELYRNRLMLQGVSEKRIISINLENPDYRHINDYSQLYDCVLEHITDDEMHYVFLDEVQIVRDFQKACDGLYIKKNVDLYITGSNASILSGELATLLAGRYVEIKMQPLSFAEYVSAIGDHRNLPAMYRDYIFYGSFPYITELNSDEAKKMYLDAIYNSVVLKDIVARKNIFNVDMLERIIRFLFDNIGNPISTNKICNTLISQGSKVSVNTVDNYLKALEDSFIVYRARRYDIKGKQYLSNGGKYYVADIGLRYYLLGSKPADRGHILENVVYLELLRRGYEVYVGKMGTSEVDFIAVKGLKTEYYQVAYRTEDDETLYRELKSLDLITDHNPKYLLTMDDDPPASYNGIKKLNVLDWLISEAND